jgi:acyl-CoA thioester hydrolase
MADFHFYHPIEIRYGDLDPHGHVNNATHLTYFEQARVQYFIHLGLFSKDQSFMEIGVILADAHITYLAPVYFGTKAKVGVRATKIGNKSIITEQVLIDEETGLELSKATVVLVTFDYHTHKTIPVPENWREKLLEFEGIKLQS